MNFNQIREYAPELTTIAQKHRITKVYVFGSVARGDATPKSDIDFLVKMEEGASLLGVAGFMYECEQLLGVKVNVVPLSNCKWSDLI